MKKSHSSLLSRMPREHGGSEAEALDVIMVCGGDEEFLGGWTAAVEG